MNLSLLELFACPACSHDKLEAGPKPLPAGGRLMDGKLSCRQCSRAYPVRDGVADFFIGGHRPSFSQRFMEMSPVTKIYEENWRPRFIKTMSPGLEFGEEMRIVTRWLRAQPGETVLDLACGPGLYSRPLAKLVAGQDNGSRKKSLPESGQVIGVDISVPMLKQAVKLARAEGIDNVTYIRADVHKLPFRPQAMFDHATCMAAYHLFPDPQKVASSVGTLVKPGGNFLLLTTRTSSRPLLRAAEKASERFSGLRFFDSAELDNILRGAGFIPEDRKAYGAMVMLQARRSA